MSKIRILPEQLANQIAAGEVVERPASVVKELIENSLDADADSIEIEIEGGGTRLIRVIDNGEGMDEDDILLCFERHGTSKIKENSDLSAITSLGFRGEAIPSIASVSKMIITSRQPESTFGTTVICQYGSIKKVHETGAQVGTTIEIGTLFGNTPARRKFLRTNRTELSHIDDTVKNYSLARPDVSFVLRIDGREVIRTEQGADLERRLAKILNYQGGFIVLNGGTAKIDNIKVSGLLVPPESSSPVATRLRLFVNGRAIKDRMLSHAVNEGLRSFMLKGRSPAGIIQVDLPPESIDVNVHPAKNEIRFKDSRTVHQSVCDTVRRAMVDQQQHIRQDIFSTRDLKTPQQQPSYEEQLHDISAAEPISRTSPLPAPRPTPIPFHLKEKEDTTPIAAEEETAYDITINNDASINRPASRDHNLEAPVQVEDLLVIGSFLDLYIFCRNRNKLVVIDQHAAHERLLFEDLNRQFNNGKIASQNLLFPISMELSVFQSRTLEKNQDIIENMGFSIRDFGGNTWILAAVPALAGTGNGQELFFDVLEQFGSEKDRTDGGRLEHILATMACKAAVKSGDQLSNLEIKSLLEKMAAADLFSHCPHGRPVVKIFDDLDIKKWFYRT